MGNSLYAFEIGNEVDSKLARYQIVIVYPEFNSINQAGGMVSIETGIGQSNAT